MGVLFFMIEGVIVIVIQTSDMIWILVPRIKHPEPLQALVLEEYKDWKANHENKEKIWKGKKNQRYYKHFIIFRSYFTKIFHENN